MSVDFFLLINLLALIHCNKALPAQLSRPGRVPRTSCVIPEPRLPKLHTRASQPTPAQSVCPPLSWLLHSACCTPPLSPRVLFHPRHTPTSKTRVSILGSNWRRAQVRWLNVLGQLSSVLIVPAPLGLMCSAVVPTGAFSIRDTPQPPKPRVSTLDSN